MATTFYGTEHETYYSDAQGILWCVQSPDLEAREGRPVRVDSLPPNARALDPLSCADLDVSQCVALGLTVGHRVRSIGGGEDDEGGVLHAIDGDVATVGWDSGVRTTIPVARLRTEVRSGFA